jgi:hypothetical protein
LAVATFNANISRAVDLAGYPASRWRADYEGKVSNWADSTSENYQGQYYCWFDTASIMSTLSGQKVTGIRVRVARKGGTGNANTLAVPIYFTTLDRSYGVNKTTTLPNSNPVDPQNNQPYFEYSSGARTSVSLTYNSVNYDYQWSSSITGASADTFGQSFESGAYTGVVFYWPYQDNAHYCKFLGYDSACPIQIEFTYEARNTAPYWGAGGANITVTTPNSADSSGSIWKGSYLNFTWNAAVDADNNISYYVLSVYNSTTGVWNETVVYGTSYSNYVHSYTRNQPISVYIKAVDALGLETAWDSTRSGASTISVYNNLPVFTGGSSCTTNPSGIFASTTNTIGVNWTAASDHDAHTITYEIYRSVNGGAFAYLTSTTATSYSDTGANGGQGTTYAYKIYAKDPLLEYADTQLTSATTTKNTVPAAPTSLSLKDGSNNTLTGTIAENISVINVNWTASSDANGHTVYYDVYRSNDNGVNYIKVGSLVSGSPFADTIGAGNQGVSYRYKLVPYDGLEYGTLAQTGNVTKNVMTAPTLNAIASITYSAVDTTKSVSWTAASDTLVSAMTYKITSADITINNNTVAITSAYSMPIKVSGVVGTPYINFSDLRTKFSGSAFVGTINITLTATNAYGSTKTSTVSVSIDLRTNPTGLGTVSTNEATSTYRIPASTGLYYYIPNRKNIYLSWTAATDPNGSSITYTVQGSYNSGAYVTVQSGLTATNLSFALPEQAAATTAVFKVIATSGYGYTAESSASSVWLHYYRSPTIVITNYQRTETSAQVDATITYNTSITEVAVKTLSTLTYTGKSGIPASMTLTLTPTVTETVTSAQKYNFTYTVQDIGGSVIGTAAQTVSVYVNSYAPMFSIREKGVAINNVVPSVADAYIFRIKGGFLVEPDASNNGQIVSTLATGTAPFVVASTTNVANLNASLLSGLYGNTAADATAATHYFFQKASDNTIRPKTLANVKTEIVTKAAIEASLTGEISTHTHAGGGSFLPLSGGTMTGQITGAHITAIGTGNDYNGGGFETIGNGATNTVHPTIGFHQPTLYGSSIQTRGNGDFRLYVQGAASYGSLTLNALTATGDLNFTNYGLGLVGLYSSTLYQGVFSMGAAYKPAADGSSLGTLYGIAWTHTNVGGQSKGGLSHQALFVENGVTKTAIGTGIWTAGHVTVGGAIYLPGGVTLAKDGGYDSLTVSNPNGYIQIGPLNAGTCHIYTDRASFYFNKSLSVNGATVWTTNDFYFQTS